jgi:hypothetical protein
MFDPGRNAYRGFAYQIQVTAWLALVFLREGDASRVIVEPLGGEDLKALDVSSGLPTVHRPVHTTVGDIVVQVKGSRTVPGAAPTSSRSSSARRRASKRTAGRRVPRLAA